MCAASSSSFGGHFDDYAHRLFLTTNEEDQSKTLNTLANVPVQGDTFVGVSGFFSLNAAAVRGTMSFGEIKHIVIVDRGSRVEAFWKETAKIIRESSSRAEVIEKGGQLIEKNKELYFGGGQIAPSVAARAAQEAFQKEISDGTSWLSSDEKFQSIKRIFDAGCFEFRRVDLFSNEQVEDLMDDLDDQGRTVDTVYVSNVHEYLETPGERKAYNRSLKELIGDSTVLVHALPRNCIECAPLAQKVSVGIPSEVKSSIKKPGRLGCDSCYSKIFKKMLAGRSNSKLAS